MVSKSKDFGSLASDLAKVTSSPSAAPPLPAIPERRGPGRPEADNVQFTLRISRDMKRKLTKMAAREQDETEQNVTAQQVAVRILEAAVYG